jgi:hypothetical protein
MHLTGKTKAEVAYVLLDTPEELAYYPSDKVSYENIDLDYRVKVFPIEYDPSAIAQIQMRVLEAREYIQTILKNIKR